MRMISVVETAKKWNISERSVRNYCAQGRVPGAVLNGKVWSIPEDAEKPERSNKKKQIFYRKKKQRNIPAVFIIKRRLS